MDTPPNFDALWKRAATFRLPPAKVSDDPSVVSFSAWVDALVARVEVDKSPILLRQAIYQLTKEFFEYYLSAPDSKRRKFGSTTRRDVFRVFVDGYKRLNHLQLDLDPEPLHLPPPPPKIERAGVYFIPEEEGSE